MNVTPLQLQRWINERQLEEVIDPLRRDALIAKTAEGHPRSSRVMTALTELLSALSRSEDWQPLHYRSSRRPL